MSLSNHTRLPVIVTGGLGFIGSHTVVCLQEVGYDVLIIDNLDNAHADVIERITQITGRRPDFIKADVRDAAAWEEARTRLNTQEVGVIHFAAHKSVSESVREPGKYYDNNVGGLTTMLHALEAFDSVDLIFSSSCTVYGRPTTLPVDEDTPYGQATNPYGHTKQLCEQIIASHIGYQPSLRCLSLRYFNPVGAHPSGLIGERPQDVPDNLFPYMSQTAAGLRPHLRIFGDDYLTPDGTAIRDYIHVVDVAKAHVAGLRRLAQLESMSEMEVLNVGTGQGYSVMEVYEAYNRVNRLNIEHEIMPRRDGDIPEIFADTAKASAVLGWQAEYGLDDMVRTAWAWERRLRRIDVEGADD